MKVLEPPRSSGHATIVVERIPPKSSRRVLPLAAIAAGILVIAILAATAVWLRPKPAAAFVTQPVAQGVLAQSVTATGTVNPQNTIAVGSQVSGLISEVDVDFNSQVKKGQVLAKIDPATFQAQVNSAQAALAQSESQATAGSASTRAADADVAAARQNAAAAQAALASARSQIGKAQAASALAEQTVARDQQLLAQGYIAQAQFDADRSNAVAARAAVSAAEIGVQQAQAQAAAQDAAAAASLASAQGSGDTAAASAAAVEIQRAQLAQAQYNLDHTVITSPVDGTVISRGVSVGETVAASFQTPTLFSIAQDLTKMEVDLQVGEPDIGSVAAGDPVSFTVLAYPARTFTGTVAQVRQNPTTVSNVVTYTTVVLVDNKDGALRPGMTANASISVAKIGGATIVPVAALQWHPAANAAAAGAAQANAAAAPASPWGAAQATASATVVAGTNGRVFATDGKKLRMVPVRIEMVSGVSAAVSPLRGTLGARDAVVVGGGTRTSRAQPNRSSTPLAAAGPGGARIPGGR